MKQRRKSTPPTPDSIRVKRAYEPAAKEDGFRVLVDRLWPRGVSKEHLRLNDWLKEVAPSDTLRRWFAHDPANWKEFEARYQLELRNPEVTALLESLGEKATTGTLTLVYGARDEEHNQAIVLRNELMRVLAHKAARRRRTTVPKTR